MKKFLLTLSAAFCATGPIMAMEEEIQYLEIPLKTAIKICQQPINEPFSFGDFDDFSINSSRKFVVIQNEILEELQNLEPKLRDIKQSKNIKINGMYGNWHFCCGEGKGMVPHYIETRAGTVQLPHVSVMFQEVTENHPEVEQNLTPVRMEGVRSTDGGAVRHEYHFPSLGYRF